MLEYFKSIWTEFLAQTPLQQVLVLSSLPILALLGFFVRKLIADTRSEGRRRQPGQTIRVMVIDDDQEFLHAAQLELRQAGYAVDAFENPEKALALLGKTRPDLVIVDGAMSPFNGPEVLRRIRKYDKHVPVILVTQFVNRYPEETNLIRGFNDYLKKPVRLPVLLARVEVLLRGVR